MVFTASGSDLPCPCGDARLARGSMSLMNLMSLGSFGGSASVLRDLTRRCGARRIWAKISRRYHYPRTGTALGMVVDRVHLLF